MSHYYISVLWTKSTGWGNLSISFSWCRLGFNIIYTGMPNVLLWLALLLFPLPPTRPQTPPLLSAGDLEEMNAVPAEVIVHSTACSATCGLGVRQQELCPMREGQVEKGGCRMRWVRCLDTWQCGLQTITGPEGGHLELDCLGQVMEAMGRYSFRVSWRYARGIITSDDSLFVLYNSPHLDRVVLGLLQEDNAGTYRCEVQDSTFHLVKRVYKGVRVVPPQVLSLDYDSALVRWDKVDLSHSPNLTGVTGSPYTGRVVRNIVLTSLVASAALAGLILLGLSLLIQRRRWWKSCRRGERVLLARLLPPPGGRGGLEGEGAHTHLHL
ncbi:transmembrane protein 81 isoform X1 [Hypomesus transpacificus]|uniref:transmembrane protein 81 isoform X1 n=2 Tax=Hypomesus transpacificus TaxID=137520 RepID=UPI001F07C27E|nr:transmembrane protein 81 isoform X1 [Hypomesus transpacificus]